MSVLLYESYVTPTRTKSLHPIRIFARTKDSEKTLAIALAAGKATITYAEAWDMKTGKTITKAYPGQLIGVGITIRNDGDTDVLWVTLKDKDTGIIIKDKVGAPCDWEGSVGAGATPAISFLNIVMPNKPFNILAEAGHGSK